MFELHNTSWALFIACTLTPWIMVAFSIPVKNISSENFLIKATSTIFILYKSLLEKIKQREWQNVLCFNAFYWPFFQR